MHLCSYFLEIGIPFKIINMQKKFYFQKKKTMCFILIIFSIIFKVTFD